MPVNSCILICVYPFSNRNSFNRFIVKSPRKLCQIDLLKNRVKLTYTVTTGVMRMNLYREIFFHVLCGQKMKIGFPNLEGNIQALLESICHQTLEKRKEVIHDDSLDDPECFAKIEKIVCL